MPQETKKYEIHDREAFRSDFKQRIDVGQGNIFIMTTEEMISAKYLQEDIRKMRRSINFMIRVWRYVFLMKTVNGNGSAPVSGKRTISVC